MKLYTGFLIITSPVFLLETYESTILEDKAKLLRKETDNPYLKSKYDKGQTSKQLITAAVVCSTKMLLGFPINFLLAI